MFSESLNDFCYNLRAALAEASGLPSLVGYFMSSSSAMVDAMSMFSTVGKCEPGRMPAPERTHNAFILGSVERNPCDSIEVFASMFDATSVSPSTEPETV